MDGDTRYAGREGDWLITFSGKRFYPQDPRAADVDFRDIGHALSLTCRYAGHVRRFYSVAEHSVLMAIWFEARGETELARWALIHDGAEAYIGDMVRPLKRSPELMSFLVVEAMVEMAVFQAAGFRIPTYMPEAVKRADTRIIQDERLALFRPETLAAAGWTAKGEGLGVTIAGHPPHVAEREFATAFARLFPELADR
jgi:hypothetical protein